MNFQAQATPLTASDCANASQLIAVEPTVLWTVVMVETSGFGFLADRRPRILFERHYFHRLTDGRFDSTAPDISAPSAGGYQGGAAEYDRLAQAFALDETAALQSASWGIGQIMGANFQSMGYPSVQDMVIDFVNSEAAQLLGMAKFINTNQLDGALQQQDWRSFARGYNGPSFEKNQYDQKLAEKYAKLLQHPIDFTLRAAQAYLTYLGYNTGGVDGWSGQHTVQALQQYQTAQQLAVTGVLDTATAQLLGVQL
jgi:hypothetical protein